MNEKFFSLPEDRQHVMLNAGFAVFSRNAYKKASMDDVAREAGAVSYTHLDVYKRQGELYGFGTPTGKVELYSTIIEKLFDESQALPYYEEPFEYPVSTPEVAEDYPLIMTCLLYTSSCV